MDAAAERRQQAQPPVAELVAEALDDDPPVGRQRPDDLALVLEVGQQVLGGQLVEVVRPPQAVGRLRPAARAAGEVVLELADERPSARPSSIGRPTASPFQNGSLPGTPGAGVTVTRSWPISSIRQLLAPRMMTSPFPARTRRPSPRRARRRAARASRLAGHEHAEQAAVGDRAAAGDRDDPGVAAALDGVGHAVPDDPRLELGELVRRVGAGEHAEDASRTSRLSVSKGAARSPTARSSSTDQVSMTAIATSCWARTSSGLRGMTRRLDRALVHPLGDDRASSRSPRYFGKITPLLGAPTWWPARPDPLEAAGDAGRALDLDDEVDRAHVDAELEAGRRDERRQPAGLELLLDLEPLLPGDAAVVGADEVLAGQLVEALGEALREPAAVGEDDRAAVGADQLEDPRVDRRPDAGPQVSGRRRPPGCSSSGRTSPSAAMSSTGTTTSSSSGLRAPASTIVTSRSAPIPPRKRAMVSSGRCVALRPMRWGGRRSPGGALREALEALEGEREVGAALRAGDRVDLVDDDVLDAREDVAGLAE